MLLKKTKTQEPPESLWATKKGYWGTPDPISRHAFILPVTRKVSYLGNSAAGGNKFTGICGRHETWEMVLQKGESENSLLSILWSWPAEKPLQKWPVPSGRNKVSTEWCCWPPETGPSSCFSCSSPTSIIKSSHMGIFWTWLAEHIYKYRAPTSIKELSLKLLLESYSAAPNTRSPHCQGHSSYTLQTRMSLQSQASTRIQTPFSPSDPSSRG